MFPFRLSVRAKMLLASAVLLVIPYVGYRYVQAQPAPFQDRRTVGRHAQGVHAPEERRHPRQQMLQADVFGQIVICPHSQPAHCIEIIIASRKKNNGYCI